VGIESEALENIFGNSAIYQSDSRKNSQGSFISASMCKMDHMFVGMGSNIL
jgi:hypothetical protein